MSTLPCNCAFTSFNPCSCSNYPIVAVPVPVQEVFGGNGSPVGVVVPDPSLSFALYIQTDSSPAGQLWQFYSGGWHAPVGGGAGVQEVYTGNGAPAFTPASAQAIYMQQDSVPPGIIWQYYNGVWH